MVKYTDITQNTYARRDFWRVFLMVKYTDITQNTYVQSSTVTEKSVGFLAGPHTVPVS
jgi:hypothetical protein